METTELKGGMANAGAVFRRGDAVNRPAPRNAPGIHAFLDALAGTGFTGAPRPLSLGDDGREELSFLPGDVPIPPFPEWSLSDDVLASVGRLLRRFHDAARDIPVDRTVAWPTDLADPEGGPILCHNDVCQENVTFVDGEATGIIDFDFAAPGRPLWDVAMTATYWVPLVDPDSAEPSGRVGLDEGRRLRVFADAYGLGTAERHELLDVAMQVHDVSRAFVAARVERGEQVFVDALASAGGWPRWDRMRQWLVDNGESLLNSLTVHS